MLPQACPTYYLRDVPILNLLFVILIHVVTLLLITDIFLNITRTAVHFFILLTHF